MLSIGAVAVEAVAATQVAEAVAVTLVAAAAAVPAVAAAVVIMVAVAAAAAQYLLRSDLTIAYQGQVFHQVVMYAADRKSVV